MPNFAKMYIYDTENEAANRAHHNDGNLEIDVLQQLQGLLHEVNHYAQVSYNQSLY